MPKKLTSKTRPRPSKSANRSIAAKKGRASSKRSSSASRRDQSADRRGHSEKANQRGQSRSSLNAPKNNSSKAAKSDNRAASRKVDSQPEANLPTKVTFVEIDENHDGQRLDNFLITHLKGVPKTHIYRIIRKGEIRVNKGRVKQTTRLKLGDSLRIPPIRLSDKPNAELDGSKYSFLGDMILFEDDALLVLNKPSGMAVHAGSGIKIGVIEALRAYRTDLKYVELVHRLDRETSGVLVLAKKASALKILHDDFKTNSLKNPRLDKRYLTLVKGQWQHGQRRITKALNTNARRHGERNVVVDPNGSYASSIVTPKSVSKLASLVEVKLLTGRTHQVRVHCLSENHPVAGDQKYGDDTFNKQLKSSGLSRLFLHAAKLTFFHPLTQAPVTIEAPLPKDLSSVLSNLALDGQP